jgi:2-phospho-L-lactate guanylyltransferase
MTFWAIVPVKPLRIGKSRLSSVLTDEERFSLNYNLLANTLDTLAVVREIEHVLVVSRDPETLSIAREHGARTVLEHGMPELNTALARATMVVKGYTTRGVLIIPADLPLIAAQDIRLMLSKAASPPVVVAAPDRRREGTNALLISPVGLIQYRFGPGSFRKHCDQALQMGAQLEICELPSLGLDMDVPEDLDLVTAELDRLALPSETSFSAISQSGGFYV